MRVYSNLLILRIRMPLVADFFYPRNLITKLLLCEKVRRMGCFIWRLCKFYQYLDV